MAAEKQKKAIKKMVENGGNISKAMREVGYSPAYAKNPQKFTNTKTYQELIEEYLPDEMIIKCHSDLVNSSEIQHYLFPNLSEKKIVEENLDPQPQGGALKRKRKMTIEKNELTNDEIRTIVESVPGCRLIYIKRDWLGAYAYFQTPDNRSRKEAVDMAYKLKGSYAPERKQVDFKNKTNDDLAKEVANELADLFNK